MITAATYEKLPIFRSRTRLTFLCETLLHLAAAALWRLQAWAVFPNHYHFVAVSPSKGATLSTLIGHLHTLTAKEVNQIDRSPGRRVWFQYWESRLTYERSYLARLNYVHTNAVHHGLVRHPSQYEWCSAGWFERKAEKLFYETVMRIRSDRVRVLDDFDVDAADIRQITANPNKTEEGKAAMTRRTPQKATARAKRRRATPCSDVRPPFAKPRASRTCLPQAGSKKANHTSRMIFFCKAFKGGNYFTNEES